MNGQWTQGIRRPSASAEHLRVTDKFRICCTANSLHIEHGLLAGAVAAQRAVLADGVGTLEDPVLPRGQPGEDFRLHRLRPAEAQVRLHAGERVGREARALLQEHADFVVPVDVVGRERDEPELLAPPRRRASSRSTRAPARARPRRRGSGFAAASVPFDIGYGTEIRFAQRNRGRRTVVAVATGRSACSCGRRRKRVRPACRQSTSRARPARPACARSDRHA